jgi:hypothetical protein
VTVQTQIEVLHHPDEEAPKLAAFHPGGFPAAEIARALDISERKLPEVNEKEAPAALKRALAELVHPEWREPR